MKILAIESSFKTASCAICDENKIFCFSSLQTGLTHSQTLMVLVDNMFKVSKIAVEEIKAVAVAFGPGSFTGIRIGVSAAKGFSFGLDIPCIGISSLFALARNVVFFNGLICSLIDARNYNFYFALFRAKDGKIKRIWEDDVCDITVLSEKLNRQKEPIFFVGDGAEDFVKNSKLNFNFFLAPIDLRFGSALSVGLLAAEKIKTNKYPKNSDISVNYIRLSQAEQNRLKKSKGE